MNNLAQPFGAKVTQLPINGHVPADMDRRQPGIGFDVTFLIISAGHQLQLVRLVQSQRVRAAPVVVLPLSKSNETRARHKSFGVVVQDIARARSGDEPPDHDLSARTLLIDGTDFEFIERLFERAAIANLETAGNAHGEIERRFQAVIKVANLDHARAIFVTRRKIVEQVLDGDAGRVFSRRHFGQSQGKLARALLTKARNSGLKQIENSGVQGDGTKGWHRRDHNTARKRAPPIASGSEFTKLPSAE